MKKQVDKTHYDFTKYVNKQRWASMWHQLDEVLKLKPNRVLEIGPGPGIFKATGNAVGLKIETLDIDPDLKPDYVASIFDMPFEDGNYDVVCTFQMLEHIPYEKSLVAFREMARIAKKGIVISLPDAKTMWPMSIYIPKIGTYTFFMARPSLGPKEHGFDGQHHWEINRVNYPFKKILGDFVVPGWKLNNTFRVHEAPYHRFLIFTKIDS